jgi:uncharacterized protein (TIGR00369 family)
MSSAEIIRHIEARRSPVWDLLNGKLVGYDETLHRVILEWRAETCHCHSVDGHPKGGIVQGGIVTSWLDVAMANVCLFRIDPSATVATLEVKVAFLAPAHPGIYRSYGYVVRAGRNVAFLEAELRDANDALIAKASATASVRAARSGGDN